MEVTINNYKQIEQAILENHIDLALIEGNSSHPQLLSTPYRDNHMVFVASPSYRAFTEHFAEKKQLSIRELENCDFILREQGSANRALFDSLMVLYDIEGKILWESISTQAIINAVKEGLGVSLLSWALVKQTVHAGELIVLPIQEAMLKRSFCIIYHKNKYLTPAATDFIRICKESNP